MDLEQHGVTADTFEDCFGEMRFVFDNSAGIEIPLGKHGSAKLVSFKNAKKFAQLVLDMRLNESAEQIACIRSGMAMVVPIGCLSLWTWRDLELGVCGNPFIDLTVLKRHSNYEDFPEHETNPTLKFFWETLESFCQEELADFLRF